MSHAVYGCIATTEFTDSNNVKKIQETNEKIGFANESEFPATGFFNVQKKDGIWWLITPEGEKFYSVGIAFVELGKFYYGNISDWIDMTQDRLNEWGFNTLNGGDGDFFPDMPHIYKFSFKQITVEDGWKHRRIPDVFDKGWQEQVRSIINETAKNLRGNPNIIGYQTDNEMKWGPDVVDDNTLLETYMAANKSTSGKIKTVDFLRERYDNNTDDFNHVWNMDIEDFDDLFDYTRFGVKGWKIRGGRAKDDIDIFSRLVPLLSSEYSFPGRDSIWPIIPKAELIERGIIISAKYAYSQEGRANLFEWYAKKCLNTPYLVGHTWFSYRDKLNVVNWGLVNLWDEPYEPLVKRMTKINKNATELHENASPIQKVKKSAETGFQFVVNQIFFNNCMKEPNISRTQDENITCTNVYKTLDYDIKGENYISYYNTKVSKYVGGENTLYVGGGGSGNYSKIQDAIDNASDGDTVFVYNGTYSELIHVDKSINLLGQDRNETIISGTYEESDSENMVITVASDHVKIMGFTITGEGGYFLDFFLRTCSGISIDKYENCTISGNILNNLGNWGIRARQSNNNTITDNVIYNVLNKIGCNIFVDSSNNTCIKNNILLKNTICCIWISRCRDTSIQENIVSHSLFTGIILESSNNTRIYGNAIQENGHAGILLRNSNNTIITSNNFIKNINCRFWKKGRR
jgi:parallel beta-helix repeat protein